MNAPVPESTTNAGPQETRTVLRIEHAVMDFDTWKRAFDSDPVGRAASGVVGHRVMRAVDDPGLVMIDLEFTAADAAVAMLASLRELWGRVTGTLILKPQARIVEVAERRSY